MKNWEETTAQSTVPPRSADAKDVQTVWASAYSANFAAEYWDDVFEHFLKEYGGPHAQPRYFV